MERFANIRNDFFEQETIKRIYKSENGASVLMVLLAFFVSADKKTGNVITDNGKAHTMESFAEEFDFTVDKVKNAIKLLEKEGFLIILNDKTVRVVTKDYID